MKKAYIDTNLLIRFFTQDNIDKALSVRNLLKKAEQGEVSLILSLPVFCEVIYVLKSPRLYAMKNVIIHEFLSEFIFLTGIKIEGDRSIWEKALDLFLEKNIDYEDAFLVASMKRHNILDIYSYDRDFDKFEEIQRLIP